MIPTAELTHAGLRLLEVRNRARIPTDTYIKFLVSSYEILHSRSIPSFGVKINAYPGRLNQAPLYLNRAGVAYGPCSKNGGLDGLMPVVVRAFSFDSFVFF
jgi:heme/copper-type cytochrome/quinol oxidase subunit 2